MRPELLNQCITCVSFITAFAFCAMYMDIHKIDLHYVPLVHVGS